MSFLGLIKRVQGSRLASGVIASYAAQATAIIGNFIVIPMFLNRLGQEGYGLWMTVAGITGYLGLLNLGLVQATGVRFAQAIARGDGLGAVRVCATGFWSTARMALWGAVATVALLSVLPLQWIFKGSPALVPQARVVLLLCALGYLAELPLQIYSACLRGIGEIRVQQSNVLLQTVVRLAGAVLILHLGGSLALVVVFQAAVNVGTGLLNGCALRFRIPGLSIRWDLVDSGLKSELQNPGAFFLLLQVSGAIAFNADALVISGALGTAQVAPYSVAQRITVLASSLLGAISANFGPRFLAAHARGESSELRVDFRRALLWWGGGGVVLSFIVVVVGPGLIQWWVGPASFVGFAPFLVMVAVALLNVILGPSDALLQQTANHKTYALFGAFEAGLNLTLSLLLATRMGVFGVVLGTLLARVLGAGPFLIWKSIRILGQREKETG